MEAILTYDPVFHGQEDYRVLLDAMSRPGTIHSLPDRTLATPEGILPTSALVALTLMNGDVSFWTGDESVREYLVFHTGGKPEIPARADFVFLVGADAENGGPIMLEMKTGTLPYPEEGATAVIDVRGLHKDPFPGSLALRLAGPGVDGSITVYVNGLDARLLENTREMNAEFPLGIDLILTDPQGRLLCLPRSSQISVN